MAEVNEPLGLREERGELRGECGGGGEVGDEAVAAGGDDVFVAAAEIGERGDGAGHGFEGDVGEAFVCGGDREEIERLIARARVALEAEPVDACGERRGLRAGADGGLLAAAEAGDDEVRGGKVRGDFGEGAEQDVVALERAEAPDDADAHSIRGQVERAAGGGAVTGREVRGVHAVGDDGDFFRGKTEREQLVAHRVGDGVDGAAGAVKPAALAEAAGGEFVGGELAVLALHECGAPSAEGGEGGVNERAEIVAVDGVGAQARDFRGEPEGGARGEAARFAEDADVLGMREALGEGAAAFEAGDVDFKAARLQRAGHVDDAVFHPAGFERIDDVEDFHERKWRSARRRKSGGSKTRCGRRNQGQSATEANQ